MTPHSRPASKSAKLKEQAANRRKGVSPFNGVEPPPEHRFKPGQTGNPHGRPRKLRDLQELIYETFAEDGGVLDGERKTRAQMLIRTMLVKSPSDRIALLEYAFGKVPQQIDVNDVSNKSDSELVRELQHFFDAIRARESADAPGGTPAAGTGEAADDPAA